MRTSSIVPSKLASLSKVCSSRADSQRVLSTVRSGSDHVIFQADASQTPRAVPNGESTFVDADRILSVRLQGDALSSSGKHLEFLVKLRNSSSAWWAQYILSELLSHCRTPGYLQRLYQKIFDGTTKYRGGLRAERYFPLFTWCTKWNNLSNM